jgi:hypothetical protein
VFIGLIASGALLAAGHTLQSAATEGLAAYAGWFLAVYSAFAYATAGTLFLLQRNREFWRSLYPVNFGLTLVAASLFGVHSELLLPTLIVALVGLLAGALLFRFDFLSIRVVPLALLISLCTCFVPSIATRWIFVFIFVAAVVLTCSSLMRLSKDAD